MSRVHPLILVVSLIVCGRCYAGSCTLLSHTCVDGPSTKVIGGQNITRDCWQYHSVYSCLSSDLADTGASPTCTQLQAQGCSQTGSTCSDSSGSQCSTYAQTYTCPGPATSQTPVMDCGMQLACANGDCFNTGYTADTGLGKAATMIYAMKAVSDELSVNSMEIFVGNDMRCGVSVFDAIGVQNCCSLTGWATGVLQCNANEKLLAQYRNAKECHYVGSYCANKTALGVCTVNEQTYCCFDGKLSRIIAEQGRPQLNRGWGTPTSPDCSGFSLTELQQLDFNKMDLSEFYDDALASMPIETPSDLSSRVSNSINQQMSTSQ